MIIEALIAFTFVAALVTFVAPNKVAGKLAFGLSLVPIVGSLLMWSQYDATGNALLGGTLALTLVNGFFPNVGDSFTILTCGSSCTGSFASVVEPPGTDFQVVVNQKSVVVQVTSATDLIFADGFASGNTTAWSAAQP